MMQLQAQLEQYRQQRGRQQGEPGFRECHMSVRFCHFPLFLLGRALRTTRGWSVGPSGPRTSSLSSTAADLQPTSNSSRTVLMHRHGENAFLRFKTRKTEPFLTNRHQLFCTGAAVLNFLHRRGGFAKSRKSIVPVQKNRRSSKSSKTDGNLTILTEKIGQSRTVCPLFCLIREPDSVTDAFRTRFGHV